MGIWSYGNHATEKFARGDHGSVPAEAVPRVKALLSLLKRGSSAQDLSSAGYQVQRLTGDREGYSAVKVRAALFIVLRFDADNAYDLELVEYDRS